MKTLFKNPLFYTNFLLGALVIILGANTPAVQARITDLVKQALAAAPVTGSGTINFLARFAGAANPSSEIGDSIIFDDGAGHVGIGTGASALDSKLEISAASIDRVLELIRGGAANPTLFRMGTDGVLVVNNGGVDALTVKDGNIGIGTAGPTAPLQLGLSGVAGDTTYSVSGNGQGLLLRARESASAVRYADIVSLGVTAGGGSAIRFFTNSADSAVERMRITNSGNVSINTSLGIGPEQPSGATKLVVGGNASLPVPGAFLYINGKLYLQERTPAASETLINGMIWMVP
jgi:hypothetical protein